MWTREAVRESWFFARVLRAGTIGAGLLAWSACSAPETPAPELSAGADSLVGTGTPYAVFQSRVVTGGPVARSQAAFTYDAAAQRSVLFGGNADAGDGVADTWTYGGTYDGTWTRCSGAGCSGPSARAGSALAFSPSRQKSILFGGFNRGSRYCDTWEYDAATSTWAPLLQPASCALGAGTSAGRFNHAMAGFVGGVALFGGSVYDGSTYKPSSEFLVWNGTEWGNLCDVECVNGSAGVPGARSNASLTLVTIANRTSLFLFGGRAASEYLDDLWEFDIAAPRWTRRDDAPEPRGAHGAAFDAVSGRLFVHGGCTTDDCQPDLGAIEYDLATDDWLPIARAVDAGAPDLKNRAGIVFDERRRRIVEFGGFEGTSVIVGRTVEYHPRANSCTADADCHTGLCVNGFCATRCEPGDPDDGSGPCVDGFRCENACDNPCETCKVKPGLCTQVTSGVDEQCTGNRSCSESGACLKANGQGCLTSTDCASGNCAQYGVHVCSQPDCGRTPCMLANELGSCMPAPRGDHGECPGNLVCGDGGRCLERCAADSDCRGENYCDAASGSCTARKEPGVSCDRPTQCKLGFCTDGICCQEPCNEPCRQCGAGGSCEPRPEGEQPLAPRTPCNGEGACKGYCPGDGFACVYPSDQKPCEPSNCSGDSCATCAGDWRTGFVCNGLGQCVDHEPQSCDTFSCQNGRCFTECDDNTQCSEGSVCNKTGARGVCKSEIARCMDDGYHLELVDGTIVDCDGYSCKGNAQCSEICDPKQPDHCAPGFTCKGARCVATSSKPTPPAAAVPAAADDGCSMSTAPRGSPGVLPWIALGWVLLRRRWRARSDAST
jgi:hypothetical protein